MCSDGTARRDGMSGADWIIVVVVLVSVVQAACAGFFQEAFASAGWWSDTCWRRGSISGWRSGLSRI